MSTDTAGGWALIHGILPQGVAHDLLLLLRREFGIVSAYTHHARSGTAGRAGHYFEERDHLTVLVEAARTAEVFAFLHRHGGIGRPRRGLLFTESALRAAPLTLPPGLPEEPTHFHHKPAAS